MFDMGQRFAAEGYVTLVPDLYYGRVAGTPEDAGAGHAFFNDMRPAVYRKESAKDAWPRTLTFFQRHLA